VTESYEVIQYERAAIVFWGNRLDIVTELSAISLALRRRLKILGGDIDGGGAEAPKHGQDSPDTKTTDDSRNKSSEGFLYKLWKTLMENFDENLNDDIGSPRNLIDVGTFFLSRVAAAIFIPLWVIFGFISLGLLWPPQVPQFILVPKATTITRKDHEKQQFDKIQQIQKNLKILAVDLKKEMVADREDLMRMKKEAETTQDDVMSDLQQVRELMTTLLDMGRQRSER